MREWQSFTIGGRDYSIKPLGAIKGNQLLLKVCNALGSAAGGLLDEDKTGAVAQLLGELDEKTLELIYDAFGNCTRVEGEGNKTPKLVDGTKRAVFDEWFAAEYGEFIEWLVVCFRLNYPDFLDAERRGALLLRLGLKTPESSQSTSPDTSTGSSGES